MIGIASITFDLEGAVYISSGDIVRNSTKTGNISRRATRTATIDGGAALYDAGYSSADRTIKIGISPSSSVLDVVRYIVKTYERVTVTTDDGAFIANPNSLTNSGTAWTLTLLVIGDAE